MTKNCFALFFILFSLTAAAQVDSIVERVFLVGDAGELHNGKHEVVDWLSKHVDWNDSMNAIIYLGDNIYPYGMPMKSNSREYEEAKKIIDYQISLVKGKKARAYFIPGNHDWQNGKMGGWQRIMAQVNYINSLNLTNVVAEPQNGCPGPVPFDLSNKVVIVLMDSQWFLYLHDKPGPGSGCDATTAEEFGIQLRDIAASHKNQLLILASHHPMYSYGVHGSGLFDEYGWREHLFPLLSLNPYLWIPLPILGSVYPLARGVFGNVQDIRHPLYQQMVEVMQSSLKDSGHPNYIAVAGHDHSLQMIMKDSLPYIISGAGSNVSKVKTGLFKADTAGATRINPDSTKAEQGSKQKTLLFSDLNFGFAVLEVHKSGKVQAKFYNQYSPDFNHPEYVHDLKKIDTLPTIISKDSIPVLPAYATIAANPGLKQSGMKNFLMGRNYRQEWTTPVTAPVLDLGKEKGGLTITKQGGGKQTLSLRLEDSTGKEYALRSVKKYPEAAIPADLRSPFVNDVVTDGISASYPYGSLSIAPIAHAAGIPVIRRQLFYVPDDPRLGRFRQIYKEDSSRLAIMEEREPEGVKKADNTDKLVLNLAKDNDNHVDQKAVLKARLVDNFIMDFDRHEDQWQWATRDTGKGKIYYPIPRDHDQAFFVNQGLLPSFAKKPWFVPELQGFKAKTYNIETFNRPARNFDRFFLTELNEEQWRLQIDTFLRAMTDSVINKALSLQPKEIAPYHAEKIANILKQRRQYFEKDMITYYRFLSKEVNIVGTNQRELFTVDKQDKGFVHVTINKINKEGELSSLIYDRTFNPDVTKELRLYGLDDNDSFVVKGGATKIKVRMIGGSGDDQFVNDGSGGKLLVYDVTFEDNHLSGNTAGFTKKLSNDPQVNLYNRLFYKYSYLKPSLSAAYNIDDGLYLGADVELLTQGFRKEPYHLRQQIIANRALQTSSYHFRYEGDFIKIARNTDLLIRADVRAPINITNFFGFGNETTYDKSQTGGIRYYRARYDIVNTTVEFRRQLQSWMRIHYGGAFQYFKLEEGKNEGKFVTNTALSGVDPKTLYQGKMFAGVEAGLDIDSRNNEAIPTRGAVITSNVRPMLGLGNDANNLVQFNADVKIFASLKTKGKLVYVLRVGGGRNFGTYEFEQAQYLSGTENLRGYRKDRFAGRSSIYNNLEVRFKFKDFHTYLFPGSIGLFVFNDMGRVWSEGDAHPGLLTDWHIGNGIGFWIAPIKRFVITAAATRSNEEKLLPLVTFGFQF